MVEHVEIEQFLSISRNVKLIDVRSPKEYEKAHIPGAISFPLFSNEERALVGTCYKNEGHDAAIILGLKFVGTKLEHFAKKARELALNNQLAVHCWRGGMRSSSMAWLFSTVGINTTVLKGGYKAYRQFIKRQFAKQAQLVVLGGMTGSGKTEILKELAHNGHQVIDLEGLANHKGSAFGGIGQKEQGTTEQFENDLYEIWRTFDFDKPIWLEDESKTIGKISLPDELYEKMRTCMVISVETPVEQRVSWLLKEYGEFPSEDLKNGILKIKKRLGGDNLKLTIESIDTGNIKKAIEIVLKYYDKAYRYGLLQRGNEMVHTLECNSVDPENNAGKIIAFYQNIIS